MADNTSTTTTSIPTSALATLTLDTNVPKTEGILKTPSDQNKPLVDAAAIKEIEKREAVADADVDEDEVVIDDDKFSHYSKSPTLSARRTSFGGASVGTAGDQDEDSEDDFEIPSLDANEESDNAEGITPISSKRRSVTFKKTPEVIEEDVAAEQEADDENGEAKSDDDEESNKPESKPAVKAE